MSLGCILNRPRIERHVDGDVRPRAARRIERHLDGCPPCAAVAAELRRMRAAVQSTASGLAEPEWAGFWPAIQARILSERPKPVKDSWWLPLWKPVWGHPRLALGGAVVAATMLLTLSFWPLGDTGNAVWAGPVIVQDVSTADPNRSVMVYSSPVADDGVTVIWLFTPDAGTDDS